MSLEKFHTSWNCSNGYFNIRPNTVSTGLLKFFPISWYKQPMSYIENFQIGWLRLFSEGHSPALNSHSKYRDMQCRASGRCAHWYAANTYLKYSPLTFLSFGSVARRIAHCAPSNGFFMNSHIQGKVISLTLMADIRGELKRNETKPEEMK